MKKCDILREYSQFIDTVRAHSGEESAIKKAIRECIDRGILVDYLKQQGRTKGRQEGLILSGRIFQTVKNNPDLTNEQIAAEVGCEPEEVESTRKMFGI